jgi:hypothetical protein
MQFHLIGVAINIFFGWTSNLAERYKQAFASIYCSFSYESFNYINFIIIIIIILLD